MEYSKSEIQGKIRQFGELWLVMRSGKEYVAHGQENVEFDDAGDEIRIEGMLGDEYVVAVLPIDEIEHVYTHYEV